MSSGLLQLCKITLITHPVGKNLGKADCAGGKENREVKPPDSHKDTPQKADGLCNHVVAFGGGF